jgi:hypothetical protein
MSNRPASTASAPSDEGCTSSARAFAMLNGIGYWGQVILRIIDLSA